MGRLDGRVALVTGAGSGIGEATALLFAGEGAAVGSLDIRRDRAEATAERITGGGGRAVAVVADISDGAEVAKAIDELVVHLGRLDVVANCAGLWRGATIDDLDESGWDLLVDIMLKGTFLVCKHAVPHLRKAGGGAIVNVGSTATLTGSQGSPHYGAAKGGISGLTKSLAPSLARDGIRINEVLPGPVRTRIYEGRPELDEARERMATVVPLGRIAEPVEMAYPILFLASAEASFVTGASLLVDGGFLVNNTLSAMVSRPC